MGSKFANTNKLFIHTNKNKKTEKVGKELKCTRVNGHLMASKIKIKLYSLCFTCRSSKSLRHLFEELFSMKLCKESLCFNNNNLRDEVNNIMQLVLVLWTNKAMLTTL